MTAGYIYDHPLEANRRCAWAKFFSTRKLLEAERLRVAELAVWIERLDPPSGHSVWEQVAAAFNDHDSFALSGIRRYVDFVCEASAT